MDFVYSDSKATSTHEVTVTWTIEARGRKLVIEVAHGVGTPAKIWGTIERSVAYIQHVESGRFPSGRAVGYFMLHCFAVEVLKYCFPAPGIQLGTPVNTESITQAEARQGPMPAERAAVHIYEQCGFNVSTAANAATSSVTAIQLRDASERKIRGRWSQLFEVKL